jgi:energy-coupling factor transporter transmembrane protein EcfT
MLLIGTTFLENTVMGLIFWIGIMCPLLIGAGLIKLHLKALLIFFTPIALLLFFVWGYIIGDITHTQGIATPVKGLEHALFLLTKLLLYVSILQLFVLSIPTAQLSDTLHAIHMPRNITLYIVATFVLIPEIKLRSEQIYAARLSRGFMKTRSLWNRLCQLPFLIKPLVIWVVRAAIQRQEHWIQRGLLEIRCDKKQRHWKQPKSVFISSFYFILSLFWMIINIQIACN